MRRTGVDKLAPALESVRSNTKGGPSDLSARRWSPTRLAGAAAYRQARIAVARRRDG